MQIESALPNLNLSPDGSVEAPGPTATTCNNSSARTGPATDPPAGLSGYLSGHHVAKTQAMPEMQIHMQMA